MKEGGEWTREAWKAFEEEKRETDSIVRQLEMRLVECCESVDEVKEYLLSYISGMRVYGERYRPNETLLDRWFLLNLDSLPDRDILFRRQTVEWVLTRIEDCHILFSKAKLRKRHKFLKEEL